jgi:hypothetical protein
MVISTGETEGEPPRRTASARNAPICTVTIAVPLDVARTVAVSLPWNIGRVKVADAPSPLMPITSVIRLTRSRAASIGAKSRAW